MESRTTRSCKHALRKEQVSDLSVVMVLCSEVIQNIMGKIAAAFRYVLYHMSVCNENAFKCFDVISSSFVLVILFHTVRRAISKTSCFISYVTSYKFVIHWQQIAFFLSGKFYQVPLR